MHGQGKHIEHMEQNIKTATEEEWPEQKKPTQDRKKKNLSFRKALLTTLPINENIIVCSESPQFLLLVVAGYALSPAIKEKKKSILLLIKYLLP